jgi:GTP pyrophosphokinase
MLERELGKNGFESLLKSAPMLATAERCNYHSVEDLLAALGYGEVTLNLTVNRLRDAVKGQQPLAKTDTLPEIPLLPTAAKALPLPFTASLPSLAWRGCSTTCRLLYSSSGRGDHRSSHPQQSWYLDPSPTAVEMWSRWQGDRLVLYAVNAVEQAGSRPQFLPVDIQIEVIDRVGVLKDILSA